MLRRRLFKLAATALGFGAAASYPIMKSETEIQFQPTEENKEILKHCKHHLRKYLPSYHLFPHGAL
jgi:hypothetical protein